MLFLSRSACTILAFVMSIVFVQFDFAQSTSPASTAPSSAIRVVPPEPPVSRLVLENYLKSAGTLDANKALASVQLDATRKTLPAWFPQTVWDEVLRKVLAIDLVEVYLPVYRKYLSADTVSALTLLYQGPTGEEIARISSRRITTAIRNGSKGYSADMQGADTMAANGEDALVAKRIKELTPEQQASFVKAEDLLKPVLQQLDNEQNAAFSKKVDGVWRATLAVHNAELVAAQNAASHAHPSKQ